MSGQDAGVGVRMAGKTYAARGITAGYPESAEYIAGLYERRNGLERTQISG